MLASKSPAVGATRLHALFVTKSITTGKLVLCPSGSMKFALKVSPETALDCSIKVISIGIFPDWVSNILIEAVKASGT